MSSPEMNPATLLEEQKRIEKAGSLHWFHWFIIGCSLLLTLSAWYFTQNQVEQKVQAQFDRQAEQVVDLVTERMQKYEDALWSGVATIAAQTYGIDLGEWQSFADTLNLEERHPGINGIGVIYHVPPPELTNFLNEQRQERPDFSIYPQHGENDYWPITYIEPVVNNRQAVGLDMAHETNRYTAAKRARDSAQPQITGPIILVQDSEKTPGFLLFVPFYKKGYQAITSNDAIEDNRKNFVGLVYAPFIMKKLMQGTLAEEKRSVLVQIKDQDDILYDEFSANTDNFYFASPFKQSYTLDKFGRNWSFDIRASQEFINQNRSAQPMLILMGGIFIDIMLLGFFLLLARSNRNSIGFAKRMAAQYREKAEELEEANNELEEFAYRTSHDLRSPLTSAIGLLGISKKAVGVDDDKARMCMDYAEKSLDSLKNLIEDIMHLAKTKLTDEPDEAVDISYLIDQVLDKYRYLDNFEKIKIIKQCNFEESVCVKRIRLLNVIENLISNAIKYYNRDEVAPYITLSTEKIDNECVIKVMDNGMGIPENRQQSLFRMFKRFHPQAANGSGLGLYMAKKSAQLLGGDLCFENSEVGSIFILTIPLSDMDVEDVDSDLAA